MLWRSCTPFMALSLAAHKFQPGIQPATKQPAQPKPGIVAHPSSWASGCAQSAPGAAPAHLRTGPSPGESAICSVSESLSCGKHACME